MVVHIKEEIKKTMPNKEENELMLKRCDFYYKQKCYVHIILKAKKDDGKNKWANGLISSVTKDYILLEEFVEGEKPIFIQEIVAIEKFNQRGVNGK